MTAVMPGTAAPAGEPGGDPTFEELADRVDRAVRALDELDPAARSAAEELRSALEAVHRAGLVQIVRRLKDDESTRPALFELADVPVVRMLLSLHGIVREPVSVRAERALAGVRPQLASHGGDVLLDRVEGATAYVRLQGACNGCSMSAVTLRNLVESSLVDGVDEVTGVEVLPNEPSPTLIPLDELRIGPDPATTGWTRAGTTDRFGVGEVHPVELDTPGGRTSVILVNVDNGLAAFRNECAHEGLPLDDAVLDVRGGTLTCPWHGFCFDAGSGECLSAPGAQLERLPMRVERDTVWVRADP
ncbi:NifU family protein [Pseudonocardia sp. NPDC046786]|uniref:NifU family protein n=1 Tax=Pseudonocardia sp. NPDC046786 TaxID=3155471 RepID=UPI0034051E61